MEQIKNQANAEGRIPATFQNGLRRAFQIRHDDVPENMARLLQTLQQREEQDVADPSGQPALPRM